MSNEEYNEKTVPELRELAEERGIEIHSSATKAEIISALKKDDGGAKKGAKQHDAKDKGKARPPAELKQVEFEDMSHAELKQLAAQHNVDASEGSRADLIAALQDANVEPPLKRDEEDVNQRGAEEVEAQINPLRYEDFADPVIDGTKPIINHISPRDTVLIIVMDGSNLRPAPEEGDLEDYDHLVFVQSGASQEFLTSKLAKRKFVQDKEGQIFYYPHGVAETDDLKVVDVVALGT